MTSSLREELKSYSFILPFAVIFFIFLGFPFVYAFLLSFHKVTDYSDVFGGLRFIGLKHYLFLFKDINFWWSLIISFLYASLSIPFGISISLGLALLLKRRFPLFSVYRALFFLPFILDAFVVGIVWTFIYAPRYGILVQLFKFLGFGLFFETGFLGNPNTALPSVVFAMTLKNSGFGMILYLAALENISPEIFEAAELDGARGIRKLTSILLPLLKPVTLFLVIVGVIGSLSAFAEFYAMTGGGPIVYHWGTPLGATKVSGLYLFEHFSNLKLGLAAATSFSLLIISLSFSLLSLKLFGRRVGE
jgi:ABC-type sugar transport system permease subunit